MTIEVKTNPAYNVIVDCGMLDTIGERVAQKMRPGAKVLMISDNNVFPLFGKRVETSLKSSGFNPYLFVFSAGEIHKTTATVYKIYEKLGECGFTRTDAVINLGGGVTGDMGGFAAATFLRGIAYYQIPTSLLAQVDASIGGKTGVDMPFGKNLVGAFHQPKEVIIDPDTLKTLPGKYIQDGMGEVIKYGCISSKSLFETLKRYGETQMPEDMRSIIAECVKQKVALVEEDTRDTGLRMILNFGHTFGHALEKLHDFTGLLHGEAVAIGMVLAAEIGEYLNITPQGTQQRITELLQQYGLPTETDFTADELMRATALDKKSDGDTLNLILLTDIGEAVIHRILRNELWQVMKAIRG